MREIDMPTKYDPTAVEAGKYEAWQQAEYFNPDVNKADAEWSAHAPKAADGQPAPYSVVIPPPNVTGKLHLGHAWDTTLPDMLIRQKRMLGYDTVWIPGMDHAGIATQAKVEARLREEGVSRYDLGREKFVEQVWDWKDEYAKIIKAQWAKMGLSLDFSRERFTLDEGLNKAVNKVFVDWYQKGWIYRGEYIINWDPQARTALSDIEVIYQEDTGHFWHLKYAFTDDTTYEGKSYLEVATTRPETMYGDVALAVHPSDERYKDLVGKTVTVPVVNREIPIIADTFVEKDFGTGVVKITPAHDPNDFQAGNRHDLERINTMNDDGTMNELAGPLNGLPAVEARQVMSQSLQDVDAVIEIEDYTHSVGHSERTGVVVEPRLSTQWFVKMDELAQMALKNQQSNDTKVHFYPERFEDTWAKWMDNIRAWVISRQLWWGHQIPAWYKNKGTDAEEIYVGETAPTGDGWERDPDVLDTWFSSGLWPFSTMGWPDQTADLERYYPTSTLVTGYDIIFFWVARMMFTGEDFTGQRPFENVLLHGLARDEQGRKMSKSLGNGIDPMEVIDKYGADALRWFLSTGSTPGQDIRFSYDKMDAAWNFINKLWNVSRYILMNIEDDTKAEVPSDLALADRWILSRLNATVENVSRNFDKYEFGEAGRSLYNFIWNDFADWYLEMSKETLNSDGDSQRKTAVQQVLLYTLDQVLRLLHPIMPFVTEEIFQTIPHKEPSLVIAAYPQVNEQLHDAESEQAIASLIDLITAVRNIRAEAGAANKTPIDLTVKINEPSLKTIFDANVDYITRFTNPQSLVIEADAKVPEQAMSAVISGAEIYVPLAGLIDIDAEIKRLEDELKTYQGEVKRAEGKLNNEKFVSSAPEAVVAAERDKLADWQTKLAATQSRIDELKS